MKIRSGILSEKINTDFLSPVEVYKLVLDGRLKIFPPYFWEKPDSLESAAKITRYLIEDILKWTDDDIKQKLVYKIFAKYKLRGMIDRVFGGSTFKAINNAYPNRFKIWEFQQVPKGFWNDETICEALQWILEKHPEIQITDLTYKDIHNYGTNAMYQYMMKEKKNLYYYVNLIFPNKYQEWEFYRVSNKFWANKENRVRAIKWLVEDRLGIDINNAEEKMVKLEDFKSNKLEGLIAWHYNGSVYLALKEAYPNIDWDIRKSKYI